MFGGRNPSRWHGGSSPPPVQRSSRQRKAFTKSQAACQLVKRGKKAGGGSATTARVEKVRRINEAKEALSRQDASPDAPPQRPVITQEVVKPPTSDEVIEIASNLQV